MYNTQKDNEMKKNTNTSAPVKATDAKTTKSNKTSKKSSIGVTTDAESLKEKEELDKILGPEKPKSKKSSAKKEAAPTAETPKKESKKAVTKESKSAEKPVEKKSKKATKKETPTESDPIVYMDNGEVKQKGVTKSGKTYMLDTAKHTCKRVATSFEELDLDALNLDEMPMEVYQQYMRDRFTDEEFPIKKNKLMFKGFRISCSVDEGFKVEDTTKKYRVVELPFDGIPSPKELVDYLLTPKASADPAEKKVRKVEKEEPVQPKYDFDDPKVCRQVISKELARLAKSGEKISIKEFSTIVPFKRWQRTIRKFYKQFSNKEVRYPKLIQMITEYTKEETFEDTPKKPTYKFTGTILPEFKSVGMLLGDKLEVDGKKVDAVPFFVDYILHYVPKAMQQLMRWAEGVITDVELLREPFFTDPYIEFNKKSVKSGKHNADVLSALCASVGIVAPQDLLYNADLAVGDKILLYNEGRWTTKTITSIDEGIEYGRGVGVLKFDKWLKVEPKENK